MHSRLRCSQSLFIMRVLVCVRVLDVAVGTAVLVLVCAVAVAVAVMDGQDAGASVGGRLP